MAVRDSHPGTSEAAIDAEGRLSVLVQTTLQLTSDRELPSLLQTALDGGISLCGAAVGAVFYDPAGSSNQEYQSCKVSGQGATSSLFSGLPMPRPLIPFASQPTPAGTSAVRSDDIAADPRLLHASSAYAMVGESSAVRSYLAVPLHSANGEVFGAMVYGHPKPGMFQVEAERLAAAVAAQVALVLERRTLWETLRREATVAEAARGEQRSAEQRLKQALDAAQQGTWTWSAESGLIDFDQRGAALFGVKPHSPVPRTELWEHLVLEDDRGESPRDLQELLDLGLPYSAEYRIQAAEGGLRWIAASGMPVFDEITGRVSGMTGTVQDISNRKSQEESLRVSEKLAATGRLAATIAHEINNPLEAVTNLIYLAKTDPSTPSHVEKLLETADGELARVSQIAQQTLGFYRDTTSPVTIDMNGLLGAVVDLFGRKLAVKRLQVTLDLDPDLSIVGLQGEIRQVVSNLLVNAIDASSTTGSSIRIRGRHRHRNGRKGISVLISDQGVGIPAHVRSRLFTPFVTTKQSRGTGLGLWVTRGMIEKHGGTVRFRSRTDHPAGTVFGLFLPQSNPREAFSSPSSLVIQ